MLTVNQTEQQIDVSRLLHEYLGQAGHLTIDAIDSEVQLGNRAADYVAVLETPAQNDLKSFLVIEVKANGAPSFLAQAISYLKEIDREDLQIHYKSLKVHEEMIARVVAAPYISERGRNLCKDEGVGYMDTAGNCSFETGAYFVDKEGQKNRELETRIAKNLLAPKASRISRALLERPDRAWKLTEMAEEVDVSIGHVHAVVEKLEEQRFVSRDDDNRLQLDQPGDLLDYWATRYDVTDKESRTYYTFERSSDQFIEDLVDTADRLDAEYALTLHAGASLIAPFTRSEETHLYVHPQQLERWVDELELRPVDSGGNVHLLPAWDNGVFYRLQTVDDRRVVCNTQLYIDLYNYPARGREQAEHLREQRIPY